MALRVPKKYNLFPCPVFAVHRYEPAETSRYKAFIAGVLALESLEPIYSLGCCGTHPDARGRFQYRYALLGTGDFIAERDENTLTDGTDVQEAGVVLDLEDLSHVALLKETVTDTRQRMLFCNGTPIGGNLRYNGLYCCDGYALCTYVDDDYLSGWKEEWSEYGAYGVDRKYTPHPGWGETSPPAAKDRVMWDYYRSVYPGFAVDVFYRGTFVGTYKLSDANSPVYFDKLTASFVWELLGLYHAGVGHGVGSVPWSLEGTPKCGGGKLLIPYDGGLTTVIGTESERRLFA